MENEIKDLERIVYPFMETGKITIARTELFEYVGKKIKFDIVNIKEV